MQITKLKIFGFKSFAQRTEINFPTKGLTAVVGPNGCGKSNITDAIRWVLGEQKAAALRMGKMQDVIFSGTEERAAMSLAEVSVVIDNSDGTLNSEYSEVIVTRRVHRDGSGEYLINNQECRLRDVHALLFDSGLGSSTYSQMNADMIKAVLSDKADDRRILFEEAAGVSKYKQQRKETFRQLERVQIDMERVEDNLRSVRRSVKLYETQAEKVNEFKRLSKRLKELDLSVAIDKFTDYKEGVETLESATRRLNHEVEASKTETTVLQTKIDEKKLLISEDENAYRDLERDVQKATIELNDLNNAIGRIRDTISNLEASNEKSSQEIDINVQKVANLNSEQKRLEQENVALESDSGIDEMNDMLAREREILQVMRDKLDDLRTQSLTLSNERVQASNKLNSLRSRFERIDAEASILRTNLEKWNTEAEQLRVQKSAAETLIANSKAALYKRENALELLQEKEASYLQNVENARLELQTVQQQLQLQKNDEVRFLSRIDVLKSVANDNSKANKWLIEHKSNLVHGILSESIDSTPEYALQVETALGDLMNALVVASDSDILDLIDSLYDKKFGKALFAMPARTCEFYSKEIAGTICKLSDCVKANENVSAFVKGLLSRYFLVETLSKAMDLAKVYSSENLCFIAPNAAVHTTGIVECGNATNGALLRKIEISNAENSLLTAQSKISDLESDTERLQSLVDENSQILSTIRDDILENSEAKRKSESEIAIQNNTMQSCERRLLQLESEIETANTKINEAKNSLNENSEIIAAKNELEKLEENYAHINEELSEQNTLYREKEDDLQSLERSVQDKNAKFTQNSNRLQNIAEQIELLENSIAARKSEIEKNTDSIKKNEADEALSAEQINTKDSTLRALEERRDLAREKYELVSGDLEEWRSEINRLRDEIFEKMSELNDVGRKQQALQANLDRLSERILNEYSIDLANSPEIVRVEYSQPEADRELRDLRGKIRDLGPVNVNVMDDYEDEKKRLVEVEAQFDDLDRARASLDRTINKLDDIARSRYLETFDRIQKNFQFVFSKLFLNGETKMSLVEKLDETGKPVDVLDADIEINVRPTGKKMRGIKALSGGEHALTATALLFAIYMEKPSPYCVLDEVDGPLDDANVGRFMSLLREFSKQTLFIVVTHNKRTMAEADMLYGVTQEIKGISRIASVQLADATKFAI